MKKWFKEHFTKDKIISLVLTGVIILLVLLIVFFENEDKKKMENKQSEISLCDIETNLNTSWIINQDGNLVGNNLLNPDTLNFSSSYYNLSQNNGLFTLVSNGNGNVAFGSFENIYLLGGVTYTISKQNVSYDTDGIGLYFEENGNRYYNQFTPSTSGNYILYLRIQLTYVGTIYFNIMLNEGSTALEWEPYGVWYSENNYDNVNEQLQLQSDVNKYGWLSYIDNVELKVNNTNVREFTFNELKSENYIGADGTFNLLTLSMYNNPNYNNVSIDIYFANSIINSDTLPINLFNVSTKEGFNGTITIRDSESQVVVLNVQDVTTITYENILSANSEFNNEIYNVEFNFVSPDSATIIFANSNYSLGFQSGFNKGYNVSYNNLSDTINNLNSQVSTLTINYNNLNSQYETLSTNYATLLDQYNLISQNDYTFSELFWSISAVPFGVLTSTFNVNVMGVNLALCYNRLINFYGAIMAYKEAF